MFLNGYFNRIKSNLCETWRVILGSTKLTNFSQNHCASLRSISSLVKVMESIILQHPTV